MLEIELSAGGAHLIDLRLRMVERHNVHMAHLISANTRNS